MSVFTNLTIIIISIISVLVINIIMVNTFCDSDNIQVRDKDKFRFKSLRKFKQLA